MRTIAPSIRDYDLAESCGLGQDYDKGRTQICTDDPVYGWFRQYPTIIYDRGGLFLIEPLSSSARKRVNPLSGSECGDQSSTRRGLRTKWPGPQEEPPIRARLHDSSFKNRKGRAKPGLRSGAACISIENRQADAGRMPCVLDGHPCKQRQP